MYTFNSFAPLNLCRFLYLDPHRWLHQTTVIRTLLRASAVRRQDPSKWSMFDIILAALSPPNEGRTVCKGFVLVTCDVLHRPLMSRSGLMTKCGESAQRSSRECLKMIDPGNPDSALQCLWSCLVDNDWSRSRLLHCELVAQSVDSLADPQAGVCCNALKSSLSSRVVLVISDLPRHCPLSIIASTRQTSPRQMWAMSCLGDLRSESKSGNAEECFEPARLRHTMSTCPKHNFESIWWGFWQIAWPSQGQARLMWGRAREASWML